MEYIEDVKKKPKIIIVSLVAVVSALWVVASFLQFQETKLPKGSVSGVSVGSESLVPEDILLPSGYEILSSSKSKEGNQITLKVVATLDQVSKFYAGNQVEAGWELIKTLSNEGFKVLTFEKPGRILEVSLTQEPIGGFTIIGISY